MVAFSTLLSGIKKKNKTALAQAITLVEQGKAPLSKIFSIPLKKTTRRIGITGPPGVGKSTLIAHYTQTLVKKKRKVGILVVDPSSTISGGALLGDRVRMQAISGKKTVFIRSLASKGDLGGLSQTAYAILRLYELFGFDDIIVETVGAGQSEVDITKLMQTVVLVLIPQLGDEIQALKAGIMELTHIIGLNRADSPKAIEAMRMLESSFALAHEAGSSHRLPIVQFKKMFGSGLKELDTAVSAHHKENQKTFSAYAKSRAQHEARVLALGECELLLRNAKQSTSTNVLTIKKSLTQKIKRGL